MGIPRVRYVRSAGQHIAYSTVGDAEQDLCVILPSIGTIEMLGELPARRIIQGISAFSRTISFDRRGSGLSDPIPKPAPLEDQMGDVLAVLDACGSERVVLTAEAEGAMLAVMFAATHPDRVSHLILLHGMARVTGAPGYEWAWSEQEREREFSTPMLARWGSGEMGARLAPVLAARDPDFERWWGRWERLSGSPGTIARLERLVARMDVRSILPRVQAPTLIMDRPRAPGVDSRHAAYLAERIPGAQLRELPGRDSISFGDGIEAYIEAVEQFTLGTVLRARRQPDPGKRSCSPTSSARPSGPHGSAIGCGGICCSSMTGSVARRYRDSGEGRSSRPATGCSPPSKAPHGRCAAPPRSPRS